ncbi:MSB1A reductase, partial [Polypterus senegalus]
MYVCSKCGYELFSSRAKYKHSSPWPAFTETIHPDSVSKFVERPGALKKALHIRDIPGTVALSFRKVPNPVLFQMCSSRSKIAKATADKQDGELASSSPSSQLWLFEWWWLGPFIARPEAFQVINHLVLIALPGGAEDSSSRAVGSRQPPLVATLGPNQAVEDSISHGALRVVGESPSAREAATKRSGGGIGLPMAAPLEHKQQGRPCRAWDLAVHHNRKRPEHTVHRNITTQHFFFFLTNGKASLALRVRIFNVLSCLCTDVIPKQDASVL